MKSIRLICLGLTCPGLFYPALAVILSTVSLQAQDGTSPGLVEASRPTAVVFIEVGQDKLSQNQSAQSQHPPQTGDSKSSPPDAPTPVVVGTTSTNPKDQFGKQPKRILGIIPNYRAVSANSDLPPLDFKGELWLATQDTFDYSNFIFVGVLAGENMATKSQPAFGQGAEGYGKYYWHDFVDGAIENYMTEAIVPVATKEDPRYYTLAKGGLVKRTGYAVSRLFITRTNSGGRTFNLAEIVGAGAAAGIGNAYYPSQANPWVKTYQRWGTQVGLDGVFNVLKEFWPDIDQKIFHGKY